MGERVGEGERYFTYKKELWNMKVFFFFPQEDAFLKRIAREISLTLEQDGAEVKSFDFAGSSPSPAGVDLFLIGTFSSSILGKLDDATKEFIRKFPYFEGRKTAIFASSKSFLPGRILREVMSLLEERGAFVLDFEIIKNLKSAAEFGKRIAKIKN